MTTMSHAEKCPVCEGEGRLKKVVGGGIGSEDLLCHGCDGKGWVTVGVEYPIVYKPDYDKGKPNDPH